MLRCVDFHVDCTHSCGLANQKNPFNAHIRTLASACVCLPSFIHFVDDGFGTAEVKLHHPQPFEKGSLGQSADSPLPPLPVDVSPFFLLLQSLEDPCAFGGRLMPMIQNGSADSKKQDVFGSLRTRQEFHDGMYCQRDLRPPRGDSKVDELRALGCRQQRHHGGR